MRLLTYRLDGPLSVSRRAGRSKGSVSAPGSGRRRSVLLPWRRRRRRCRGGPRSAECCPAGAVTSAEDTVGCCRRRPPVGRSVDSVSASGPGQPAPPSRRSPRSWPAAGAAPWQHRPPADRTGHGRRRGGGAPGPHPLTFAGRGCSSVNSVNITCTVLSPRIFAKFKCHGSPLETE